jgi:uncharacterized membrane protein YphA (DoxX/SURF4 family)
MLDFERMGPTSDGAFRVLFSLIFLVAGAGHFGQKDVMLARLEAAPLGHLASLLGPPEVLMTLSGVALVVGGIALALGFKTRLAAAGLFLRVGIISSLFRTAGKYEYDNQVSIGAYSARSGAGIGVGVKEVAADEVGVLPASELRLRSS